MTLEEYWTEIVADIGNIETHGDAIAAISRKNQNRRYRHWSTDV